MWLFDAGIVNFGYNLSTPEIPLERNVKNDVFKVYMRYGAISGNVRRWCCQRYIKWKFRNL